MLLGGLALLLVAALAVALLVGAVPIGPSRLLALLSGAVGDARETAVLWQIRLPRALLAIVAGAALGAAGAAQQGLFRNPLADPALVGVSSGAALGAVVAILFTDRLGALLAPVPPLALVPASAFVAGLLASLLALRLAGAAGGGTGGLLLAGIAINAVCGAATGLFVTMSDDRQLRDITFWSMGSLSSAGWPAVALTGLCAVATFALLLAKSRALDALLLGEQEAIYLGVSVSRLRLYVVTVVALGVGAAVAATGIIGFVGLVVPLLLRLVAGPRHVLLLPGAALLGASLLLAADALARTLAAPAELPIGLITAALGGPVFVVLLLRHGRGAT